MSGYRFSWFLFVAPLAGLLAGLIWLVHLRFESGQAYPQRSSLRADPLGSKALHDAYAEVPGLDVSRNFVPFVQLRELPSNATLLLLNLQGGAFHELADFEVIVDFVERGGHLVIALNPGAIAYEHLEDQGETGNSETEVEDGLKRVKPGHTRRPRDEQERFWGELSLRHGDHTGGKAVRVTKSGSSVGLPVELPWREGGVLVEWDDELWDPLYQIDDEVVAAERAYGSGRIVVMTDDYLFSNEALLKHRFPVLLSWIVGGQPVLVFEETHLGVVEAAGVATLIRRYRLSGFAVAFVGLMALVVWRGSSPLLPAFDGRGREAIVRSEHSVEAGLSELIQRNVTAAAMPELAFRQWQRAFIRTDAERRKYAGEVEEIESLLRAQAGLPARQRRPQETHLKIKSILNRNQRKRP